MSKPHPVFSLKRGNYRITVKARGRAGLKLRSVERKRHDALGERAWERVEPDARLLERLLAELVVDLGSRVDASTQGEFPSCAWCGIDVDGEDELYEAIIGALRVEVCFACRDAPGRRRCALDEAVF